MRPSMEERELSIEPVVFLMGYRGPYVPRVPVLYPEKMWLERERELQLNKKKVSPRQRHQKVVL